jgi:hypothetical protein
VPVDAVSAAFFGTLVQRLAVRKLQIRDTAAGPAQKVRVRLGVRVESLHGEGHPGDRALLGQDLEVPVNRPEAESGIVGLEPMVQHFRRGMFGGAAQTLKDQLPLTGISLYTHILLTLNNNNYHY